MQSEPAPISVLDLGAGSGVWSIAIAQQLPQVRVTAVDWPQVIPVTKKVAARYGLTGRYTFVGGDLHSANFGQGHSIATLGHIFHSDGEIRSRQLLSKTFDALAPGGTIAIAEILVDTKRRVAVSAFARTLSSKAMDLRAERSRCTPVSSQLAADSPLSTLIIS